MHRTFCFLGILPTSQISFGTTVSGENKGYVYFFLSVNASVKDSKARELCYIYVPPDTSIHTRAPYSDVSSILRRDFAQLSDLSSVFTTLSLYWFVLLIISRFKVSPIF